MRLMLAILLFLGLLATSVAAASGAASGVIAAERRVALVIGNGGYASVSALDNPSADAEAMAAALRRLGFEVELGVDLDLEGMRRTVQSFARRLEGAAAALFYYAGHGLQVHGRNYLLPVDAVLETEADLDFAAFPAHLVLAQMERWPSVKIVILDACRDNPFATRLGRAMGQTRAARALSRGLAPIETAGGTLLAYATDPGDVAADGTGRHSPFTAALLAHVETPGVEINTMLARVRADVYRATGEQQRPWTETSLIGEFYMAPQAPEPPVTEAMAAPPQAPGADGGLDPRTIELALWEAVRAGGTAADFREYLRQHPDGIFARVARNRIAALERETAGAAARMDGRGRAPEAASGSGSMGAAIAGGAIDTGMAGDKAGVEIAALPANLPGRVADAGAAGDDDLAALQQAEAALGLGPEARRAVQARLMLAGHDPRGIDGVFGPGTRAAISAWQAVAGIAPTGYLDAAALARLERETAKEYAAWAERQRREAEARRAALEKQRELEAQSTAPEPEPSLLAAPVPQAEPAPISEPAVAPKQARSHRERWERKCYSVFSGSTRLERRCE